MHDHRVLAKDRRIHPDNERRDVCATRADLDQVTEAETHVFCIALNSYFRIGIVKRVLERKLLDPRVPAALHARKQVSENSAKRGPD
jgi:D-hexose-6-phosphate mutarotase